METKEILKYRRDIDAWVCSECDKENEMIFENCTLCGCRRQQYDPILKKWTEADERPVAPITRATSRKTYYNTPCFKDHEEDKRYFTEEEKNDMSGIVVAVILLVVNCFFIYAIMN